MYLHTQHVNVCVYTSINCLYINCLVETAVIPMHIPLTLVINTPLIVNVPITLVIIKPLMPCSGRAAVDEAARTRAC